MLSSPRFSSCIVGTTFFLNTKSIWSFSHLAEHPHGVWSCSSSLFSSSSDLPPSWAPVRPAAWRAARWPAPSLWAPTCPTASVASPTKPAWSASPAATSTATPAATRLSTWPSRTLRACPTTHVPCASRSASWAASARPPLAICTGLAASCSSSRVQGRSTAVGGGKPEGCRVCPWCQTLGVFTFNLLVLMHCHKKWPMVLDSVCGDQVRQECDDTNICRLKVPKCFSVELQTCNLL